MPDGVGGLVFDPGRILVIGVGFAKSGIGDSHPFFDFAGGDGEFWRKRKRGFGNGGWHRSFELDQGNVILNMSW